MPAESPQLTPHHSSHSSRVCNIKEINIEDTWIYSFSLPSNPVPKKNHKIYYFAARGFRGAPTNEHWGLCSELCNQLPHYEINLVSYPLVPNSPAAHSLPHLEKLCQRLEKDALDEGFKIMLMGDSAGGNIVLVLGIYAQHVGSKTKPTKIAPVQ